MLNWICFWFLFHLFSICEYFNELVFYLCVVDEHDGAFEFLRVDEVVELTGPLVLAYDGFRYLTQDFFRLYHAIIMYTLRYPI